MIHANSLAAYADIHLSDREAFVRNLYEPGIDYTDDELAALEGKSNSTRLAEVKKPEPKPPHCNCTFAGFLKSADGVTRCHNPIHGQPLYYGRSRA